MNLQATSRPTSLDLPAAHFAGWHDSSFDLREGLVVTEHGALDAWIELPPAWQVMSMKPSLRPAAEAGR